MIYIVIYLACVMRQRQVGICMIQIGDLSDVSDLICLMCEAFQFSIQTRPQSFYIFIHHLSLIHI